MPTYDYTCEACGHTFDMNVQVIERDIFAQSTPCPECKKKKLIRGVSAAAFHYDHGVSIHKRAGDGWKEVQDRIKAGSAKKNTITTK
jgi:putative FmdB family regulatory protein